MGCVLEHIARTRPEAAVVLTDGYVEQLERRDIMKIRAHAPAYSCDQGRKRRGGRARRAELHAARQGAVMIRVSEMVLPGHPDKFCDQVADAVIAECVKVDADAFGQVEVSVWGDRVWLTGGTCTRRPLGKTMRDIVVETGRAIGYGPGNSVDAERFEVHEQRHRARRRSHAVDPVRERPGRGHRLGGLRRQDRLLCRPSITRRMSFVMRSSSRMSAVRSRGRDRTASSWCGCARKGSVGSSSTSW